MLLIFAKLGNELLMAPGGPGLVRIIGFWKNYFHFTVGSQKMQQIEIHYTRSGTNIKNSVHKGSSINWPTQNLEATLRYVNWPVFTLKVAPKYPSTTVMDP